MTSKSRKQDTERINRESDRGEASKRRRFQYKPEESVGHQVRWAHRALHRELEERLRPFGISVGMWNFLRVLWEGDGLTQRELSEAVGMTAPTTVTALHAMEKRRLAVRVPSSTDGRKSNIFLTQPARDLRDLLLSEAREVNRTATAGIAESEIENFFVTLGKIRKNLAAAVEARRHSAGSSGGPTDD